MDTTVRTEVLLAILAMGCVSYLCRIAGFLLMGYVTLSPRVDAWLRALPMALMGALLGPVAFNGGPPEWAGFAVAVALTRWLRNEFVAMTAAVAAVALLRAAA